METKRNAARSLSVSAAGRGLHALGRPRVLPAAVAPGRWLSRGAAPLPSPPRPPRCERWCQNLESARSVWLLKLWTVRGVPVTAGVGAPRPRWATHAPRPPEGGPGGRPCLCGSFYLEERF